MYATIDMTKACSDFCTRSDQLTRYGDKNASQSRGMLQVCK